jgi:phosphohistidine phosphatase
VKRLILFRHGKSDWDVSFANDHARPLAERGVNAARQMGRLLSDASQVPELIVSSTAVRARTTVELAIGAGQWDSELQLTDVLYASSPPGTLGFLQELPDSVEDVMLVGHEPTWSGLTSAFTGARVKIPTAAMVAIQFASTMRWRELRFDSGQLIWLLQPRLFENSPL